MVRNMLGGLPDGFAVIQNDRFIARISSELLVEAAKTESKNLLGRLLDKVLSTSALTLRIENDRQPAVDTRMLVATMTLLKALNIAAAAQE